MQAPSFALTKIQLPRVRSSLIARPPLETRFAEALETKRLVLVCAAAGFGKTTDFSPAFVLRSNRTTCPVRPTRKAPKQRFAGTTRHSSRVASLRRCCSSCG